MDHAALKTEISTDPLGRNYAGMTDAQVAASLNTADRTIKRPVPLRDLIVYLLKKGKWSGIEDEASSNTLGVKAECKAFMVIMNNPNFSDLDLTDATVQTMLLAIKTAGLLDSVDQTAILAMADQSVSRRVELGFANEIRMSDVTKARAM
jgi:hypothetical protein